MSSINYALVEVFIQKALERRADAAGAKLVDDLSNVGTGAYYPGQPNQSSAVGEFPSRQHENLMQSINVRPAGRLRYLIGSFSDTDEVGFTHAVLLETSESGGRPFIEMELASPEFRQICHEGGSE